MLSCVHKALLYGFNSMCYIFFPLHNDTLVLKYKYCNKNIVEILRVEHFCMLSFQTETIQQGKYCSIPLWFLIEYLNKLYLIHVQQEQKITSQKNILLIYFHFRFSLTTVLISASAKSDS